MDKWHENEEFFPNHGEFQKLSVFLCGMKVHLAKRALI